MNQYDNRGQKNRPYTISGTVDCASGRDNTDIDAIEQQDDTVATATQKRDLAGHEPAIESYDHQTETISARPVTADPERHDQHHVPGSIQGGDE